MDYSLGTPQKDLSLSNANISGTAGNCSTKIRAKCVVASSATITTLNVDNLVISGESNSLPIPIRARGSYDGFPITLSNNQVIVFNSIDEDTLGNYNTSTGIFTTEVPGAYRISGQIGINTFSAVPSNFGIGISINGVSLLYATVQQTTQPSLVVTQSISKILNVNTEDEISLRYVNFTGHTANLIEEATFFAIEKLP